MTRWVLVEVRRFARAMAAPALVVAVVTLTGVGLIRVGVVGAAAAAAWISGLIAALAWLGRNALTAARGPRSDERAADRLQVLRNRAAQKPGRLLVAIHDVLWVGPAGQRVHAVDVARGVVHDIWLPEVALPVGAFAVLDATISPARVVDWLDSAVLASARRHETRAAVRRRALAHRKERTAARRERTDAQTLVQEAERLLDRQ
jgi:hypothetical protein